MISSMLETLASDVDRVLNLHVQPILSTQSSNQALRAPQQYSIPSLQTLQPKPVHRASKAYLPTLQTSIRMSQRIPAKPVEVASFRPQINEMSSKMAKGRRLMSERGWYEMEQERRVKALKRQELALQ